MTNNICRFPRRDLEQMAQFCAELTRQGIAFNTYSTGDDFVVEITGY